jgi:hypothetical protein
MVTVFADMFAERMDICVWAMFPRWHIKDEAMCWLWSWHGIFVQLLLMLKLINCAFKPCFLQSASLEQFVQEVEARSLLFVSLGLSCSRSWRSLLWRGSRSWTKPWYWLLDSSLGYILVFQLSKWEEGIIAQKECSLWVCPLIIQPSFWGAVTCVCVCIYVCLFQCLQFFNFWMAFNIWNCLVILDF